MNDELGLRLKEDRLLRNAALALLKADVANLRADLAGKGFGERIVDRISEGAVDIFEEAVELADSNRGVLAALIGAVLLWFARNPILALFTDDDLGDEDEEDSDRAETEPA
ncbi:hypothetical protein [Allopontixanthobacter sp.]|uniref:hypothetical protein n=1 Tax=Allopontixanthobacter sp. TaxID=2906452 RepID=UPI002ABC8294|nr:hypothetical protein [Allopontixanthobacter sp.]MDZ4307317.1 hypothetical protein [Allopontixanthobacter sp.]